MAQGKSNAESSTSDSDASEHSKSTAPTIHSDRPTSKRIQTVNVYHDRQEQDPRDSVSTYASTIASAEELPDEPDYHVTDRKPDIFPSKAIASNPSLFAQLFPSSRRLLIRHDDTTLDGNMNLRVDTLVPYNDGYQQNITLFHLRMHDLYSRRFSFRRYGRDSGREVCHSIRKPAQTLDMPPLLKQPLDTMLATLRPGSSGSIASINAPKRRNTGHSDDGLHGGRQSTSSPRRVARGDTIFLEFSNYAHVELKRRGAAPAKRYDYEYFSAKYQWKRECRKDGDLREVSFHLVNTQTSQSVAHIVPEILTPVEALDEKSKGGWIRPSSLWLSNPSDWDSMPDIAE